MAEPGFDQSTASRWFAVELNNTTWGWLDANTAGDLADPIIDAAHASYHHWRQVGAIINQARAASLVANVHATVGNTALAHALAHATNS